jgi:hypothetical protein
MQHRFFNPEFDQWQRLPISTTLKRAFEIALAGYHVMWIQDDRNSLNYYKQIFTGLCNLEDHSIYIGSAADFQAFSKVPQIFIEEFVKFDDLFSPHPGESWSTVQARIKQAQAIEDFDKFINQDSYDLLKLASSRIPLSPENIQNCLTVAATIAKLAGRNSLKTEDIAEALQYSKPLVK